jgi:erythromycin esterase
MPSPNIQPLPAERSVPTDWTAIDTALQGVRIVLLGEQDHGDGAAFAAKAALVRHLHEQHGFNVLAIESCFYSLHRAWQDAGTAEEARQLVPAQIHGHWQRAAETQPLWDFMADRFTGSQPLTIAGFDTRHAGPHAQAHLIGELEEFLQNCAGGLPDGQWYPEFRQLLGDLLEQEYEHSVTSSQRAAFLDGLWKLRDALANLQTGLQGAEAAFWQQELRSLDRSARGAWAGEARDEGMAANLLWLARERFPHEKIIVWAHNWHLVRNMQPARNADPLYARQFDTNPDTIMGQVLAAELGDDVYSLALVAGRGRSRPNAHAGDDTFAPLPPPVPGSLEESLLATDADAAFIDLRSSPDARFLLRGLERGRSYDLAWSEVFDGILYQREMY